MNISNPMLPALETWKGKGVIKQPEKLGGHTCTNI